MKTIDEIIETGKAAYAELVEKRNQEAERQKIERQEQLGKEHQLIRDALISHIGSLVEYVDLENRGLTDFGWTSNRAGSLVTIKLPDAAPIQLNIFFDANEIEVTRLDGNKIGGNVSGGNHNIFAVGNHVQIRDECPHWNYNFLGNETFTDIYQAVGCALAYGHLEKEAWGRYYESLERKIPQSQNRETWQDRLASAIIEAIEENMGEY